MVCKASWGMFKKLWLKYGVFFFIKTWCAIRDAKKKGIANAILVGDKEKIIFIAKNIEIDAKEFEIILLSKMSDRGQINDCIIDGPLALDIGISE